MIKTWYHESNSPSKSDYLSINGYGIQEPMPAGTVDRPHGTGDYLFMLLLSPAVVQCGGNVTPVPPDTLMVWKPQSYQYYGNPGYEYLHSWIHCDGSLVRHLINSCGIPCDTPIPHISQQRFEHYVASIHFEYTQPLPPDRRIVENVLSSLAFDIHRTSSADRASAIAPELLGVREFIEAHYAEPVSLGQLARMASVSPQHLCNRFGKAFGVSPIDYLIRVRLAEASYLLHDRNLRVGEVARRVGIDDVCYFSRLFKRRFGKSPVHLRS